MSHPDDDFEKLPVEFTYDGMARENFLFGDVLIINATPADKVKHDPGLYYLIDYSLDILATIAVGHGGSTISVKTFQEIEDEQGDLPALDLIQDEITASDKHRKKSALRLSDNLGRPPFKVNGFTATALFSNAKDCLIHGTHAHTCVLPSMTLDFMNDQLIIRADSGRGNTTAAFVPFDDLDVRPRRQKIEALRQEIIQQNNEKNRGLIGQIARGPRKNKLSP